MKKFMSLFVFLVAVGLTADAFGCGRCGIFGLRCRFSSHKKVAVAQAAVVPPQTIIINNPPASPVIVQGGSAYGYGAQQSGYDGLSAQYAALDPAAFLNQAARLVQNGQDVAKLGFSQYATVGDNQLKNQTAVAALLAAREGPNTAALREALRATDTPAPSSIRLELNSEGRWEINQATPQAPGAQLATNGTGLIAQNCAKCHTGNTPKGGITLDGTTPLSKELLDKVVEQVETGKMPKNDQGRPVPLAAGVAKGIIGEAYLLYARKEN